MPVYVSESERLQLPLAGGANVLARIRFGNQPRPRAGAPWLEAFIPNRPLPPCPAEEVWPAAGAVRAVAFDGGRAVGDGRSIFVSFEAPIDSAGCMDALAREVYGRLLRGVEDAGHPHVLRVWNYVPRIHDVSGDIDGYMLFCKGRAEAFEARYGADFRRRLCAASAVGCPGDTLVVHALAAREPALHVENPRQVAAHRYPARYGPKSPSFARATVAGASWGGTVFVSGTASIVGHESVFPGDPARQTEETLRNVEAVLDSAGLPGRGSPLGARLRSLRVYVRYPDHLDAIRATVLAIAGPEVSAAWVQAEICRPELLVEIEAIGGPDGR